MYVLAELNQDHPKNPGEFKYFEQQSIEGICGMVFRCPCGCDKMYSITFDNVARKPKDDQRWKWNGNEEKPTVRPSIHLPNHCGYHGFLTDGVFKSV